MDSDDQVSNWSKATKLYISKKCNPIPLPAQTFYVKLWDCVFIYEDEANLSSGFVPRENDDYEVQAFLNDGSGRSALLKRVQRKKSRKIPMSLAKLSIVGTSTSWATEMRLSNVGYQMFDPGSQ